MPDKWTQYAVPEAPPADKWAQYAAPTEQAAAPDAPPAVGSPAFQQMLQRAKLRLSQQAEPGQQFSDSYNDQQGGKAKRGLQGLWDSVKGIPAGLGQMAQMGAEVLGPPGNAKPVIGEMVGNSVNSLQEAGQAWNAGSGGTGLAGAVLKGAEAIPMVGGPVKGIAEAMTTGNEMGAMGQGVGNLAMLALPERVTGKVISKIKANRAARSAAARGEAVDMLVKGTKNPELDNALDSNQPANFDVTMPEIAKNGKIPDTPLESYKATTKARQFRGKEFQERVTEPLAQREDVRVGIDPEVSNLAKERVSNSFRTDHPLIAKFIDGEALNWKEAYQANVDMNTTLESISGEIGTKKNMTKQRIAIQNPEWGWLENVSQNLKKNLYESVPGGLGPQVREANRLIGRIRSVEEPLGKLATKAARGSEKGTSAYDPTWPDPTKLVGPGASGRAATGIFNRTTLRARLGEAHPNLRWGRVAKDLIVGDPAPPPPDFRVRPSRIAVKALSSGELNDLGMFGGKK